MFIKTFPKRNSGFTLIELVFVIFLMGLIASITFPRFENFLSDRSVRSGVNSLVGLIKQLRNEAGMFKKGIYLNFDIDSNEYWVAPLKTTEEKEAQTMGLDIPKELARKKINEYISLKDVIVPDEGKVFQGEVAIRFFPDGFVDQSVIHIENKNNKETQYSLIIKPLSGKVRVEKGYVEQ